MDDFAAVREVLTFLLEQRTGGEQDIGDDLREFLMGCYGTPEDHILEAYAEAALDAGAWEPGDEWFDTVYPVGAIENTSVEVTPAAHSVYLGFAGVTRRMLRDPRVDPAEFVVAWLASASSWDNCTDYDGDCVPEHRRLGVLEALLADERCRADITARAPYVHLRSLRLLALSPSFELAAPTRRLEDEELEAFFEGSGPYDEEIGDLRVQPSRLSLTALANSGEWAQVRRLIAAVVGNPT